ncbi:collagenase [Longispora sp. K20-0274]|uniref:collagenase n=1 Tax=Longispora sp. K20-0274 TaxID=3088255 RepID=UPI00399ADCC9
MSRPLNAFVATVLAVGALQFLPATTTFAAPPATHTQPAGPAGDVGTASVTAALRPPLAPRTETAARAVGSARPAPLAGRTSVLAPGAGLVAGCTPADFGSRSGSALAAYVQGSTVDCVGSLFGLTGTDANSVFRESQMVAVANGLRSAAQSYPGNNSTGVEQLVYFLRAGYYVHWYHPADVGTYGSALATATVGGLDAFIANPHFADVSDAHGEVLREVVTLTDSAEEQARYIPTYRRILAAYNSSYDAFWYMDAAVNAVYTPLFRGHQNPAFISAVTADPSLIDTLNTFALNNRAVLSGTWFYLDSNAGSELARFLDTPALLAKVRPLARGLLTASSITGATAPLWVGVAGKADYYDKANCSYYGTCDLVAQLTAAALPITHTCDAGHVIRAQSMTAAELSTACASVINQDAYFHGVAADPGPVANDNNSRIQINAFASSKDYGTYAGVIFGIDTNNGGMYLEGDPAAPGNLPNFVAYQDSFDNGFPARIWNLNHEYTHYLDGRYDTFGDFTAGQVVPDIWWVEGFAEYISYHYRGIPDTRALTEAPKHTYALSTVFQTTYANSNSDRTYQWGYLAVRYMIEKHRSDVNYILGRFRAGDYQGAYAYYGTTIGNRYDADFSAWLDTLGSGPTAPTANFTSSVAGLTATFTDASTGSITSRSWNFGDGTGSTATSPSHTYAAAGTYSVSLTVTGSGGSNTRTASVTVSSSGLPECSDPRTDALGQNCKRSNVSATAGNLAYFYIYLPAGVSTLTISSTGGTGNADLYYNPATWATPTAYTARSTNAGNTESITVTNPAAGYRYISLSATTAFSGVTVSTRY